MKAPTNHRKIQATALATLAATLLSTACKPAASGVRAAPSPPPLPPTQLIAGQVFIAQQNGHSARLGGVRIQVVEFASARDQIEKAREAAKPAAVRYETRIKSLEAELQRCRIAATNAVKAANNAIANTDSMSAARQREVVGPFLEKANAAKAARKAAQAAYDSEVINLEALRKLALDGADAFDQPWAGAITEATTDADGNYQVEAPADRETVLVATGHRALATGTREEFFWMVTIPKKQTGNLHLNNRNTTTWAALDETWWKENRAAPFTKP